MLPHWQSYFRDDPDDPYTLSEHAWKSPSSTRDRTLPAVIRDDDGLFVSYDVDESVTTSARVSGGVWIADCPTDGCADAELVNFEEALFFCSECRNASTDHKPIRVVLPDPKERELIERALLVRPRMAVRHWTPGGEHLRHVGLHEPETVADLLRENKEHGL